MAHVICPWWMGYLLLSPIRKFKQNPYKILKPYINPGITILEIGPGMGYFSIPMAKMAGENGKIVAVDVQEKMLNALMKRAQKNNVEKIIETRLCGNSSFGIDDLQNKIDFTLAFAVIHELPNQELFFKEMERSLKEGGKLFIAEPKGHVSEIQFKETINLALKSGFSILEYPDKKGLSVVMVK